MRNLLNMIVGAARARIMPLWIKLRMWTSPAFFRTKVLIKVREFFSALTDVRPRHKRDYYSFFSWLVSKRLAFVLVIALGILSALYISLTLPDDFLSGEGGGIPTYRYRAIPLKFHSGPVKILARDGYVAYEGEVDDGAASGRGVLYAADGSVVYEGDFANNMYNGTGTQYYPATGIPRYVGSFTDNVYNGAGKYYRENGTLEYSGDHAGGVRMGAGTLYNSVGSPVFQGSFLNGGILYSDFLARPTGEVAALYSGAMRIYRSSTEYCVAMPEIDALYSVKDGSNTLENQWTVDCVYVLEDSIRLGDTTCTSVRQLFSQLGEPLYCGTAWVNLAEAVAWNMLAEREPDLVTPVDIDMTQGLEEVFAVSGYNRDYEIYLYTFEKDGLLYTFYFDEAGESEFLMYAMEKA